MTSAPILLENHDIDRGKWDRCIDSSYNGMPYAYSWYLDMVLGTHWCGLIDIEPNTVQAAYKSVFPVHLSRKYGYTFVKQSPLVVDFDLYCDSKYYRKDNLSRFIQTLSHHFNYLARMEIAPDFDHKQTKNVQNKPKYYINLKQNYRQIFQNFNKDRRKNIRQSEKENFEYRQSEDIDYFFYQIERIILPRLKFSIPDYTLQLSKQLYREMYRRSLLQIFEAHKNGKTLAMWSVLKGNERIFCDYSFRLDDRQSSKATSGLVDQIIRKYAGKKCVMDFNVAPTPEISYFKKSFGCEVTTPLVIQQNSMPGLVKLALKGRRMFLKKQGIRYY